MDASWVRRELFFKAREMTSPRPVDKRRKKRSVGFGDLESRFQVHCIYIYYNQLILYLKLVQFHKNQVKLEMKGTMFASR